MSNRIYLPSKDALRGLLGFVGRKWVIERVNKDSIDSLRAMIKEGYMARVNRSHKRRTGMRYVLTPHGLEVVENLEKGRGDYYGQEEEEG